MNLRDEMLGQVIEHLIEHWMDPGTGIVAAGVFDPRKGNVMRMSKQTEEGKWLHAERNAISVFERMYGAVGPNTIVVVTLSPCTKSVSQSRIGAPCLDLLLEKGIKKVHTGVIDVLTGFAVENYKEKGIELSVTEAEPYSRVCCALSDLFEQYGQKINSDLMNIKEKIGYSLFDMNTVAEYNIRNYG